MLEAFKSMTGGIKGKDVQRQTQELRLAPRERARGARRHRHDAERAHHAGREAGHPR
jgi:hypothetical protein